MKLDCCSLGEMNSAERVIFGLSVSDLSTKTSDGEGFVVSDRSERKGRLQGS